MEISILKMINPHGDINGERSGVQMFEGWVGQFFGRIYLNECSEALEKNYPKRSQHALTLLKENRRELERVDDPIYSTLSSV